MATQIGQLGVTFPDNTLQTTAAIAGAPGFGGFTNMAVYTTTSFWTVPAGVTKCKVTVVGGGGYSGNPGANNLVDPVQKYGGGGGGGGGASIKIISGLIAGNTISITVGAAGGTSSFGAYCSATGGATGGSAVNNGGPGPGGSGGIGVGGNLNIGGGGGMGGTFHEYASFGGCGGSSILGGGGKSDQFYSNPGRAYGGGGGASAEDWVYGYAAPGAPGVVIVEY